MAITLEGEVVHAILPFLRERRDAAWELHQEAKARLVSYLATIDCGCDTTMMAEDVSRTAVRWRQLDHLIRELEN